MNSKNILHRKCVAIVLRQFAAVENEESINNESAELLIQFIKKFSGLCQNRADTVKCVFRILFGVDDPGKELGDVMANWIRRPNSIVAVYYLKYK